MTAAAWRYYGRFYKEYYPTLLLSVVASIGGSLLLFPIALLVRQVFDNILPDRDLALLLRNGGILLALYLANSAIMLWTRHVALHPLPQQLADPELEAAVAPYRGAEDAMRLPHRDPLPHELVRRVVEELARR